MMVGRATDKGIFTVGWRQVRLDDPSSKVLGFYLICSNYTNNIPLG